MNVKEFREARGLSQREFAERLGVSPSLISQIETGRTALSERLEGKIADAFTGWSCKSVSADESSDPYTVFYSYPEYETKHLRESVAKEVAVKLCRSTRPDDASPEEIAEFSVKVADELVKRLK